MLVLTRRPGETVVLTVPPSDRPTTITMVQGHLDRGGDQARTGWEAPPDVEIHRGEVQRRIDEDKREGWRARR